MSDPEARLAAALHSLHPMSGKWTIWREGGKQDVDVHSPEFAAAIIVTDPTLAADLALAAAVRAQSDRPYVRDRWVCEHCYRICATDPTIAADLALAAAVRRLCGIALPDGYIIVTKSAEHGFIVHGSDLPAFHSGCPTLTAAIEEALAAKEAER